MFVVFAFHILKVILGLGGGSIQSSLGGRMRWPAKQKVLCLILLLSNIGLYFLFPLGSASPFSQKESFVCYLFLSHTSPPSIVFRKNQAKIGAVGIFFCNQLSTWPAMVGGCLAAKKRCLPKESEPWALRDSAWMLSCTAESGVLVLSLPSLLVCEYEG